MSTQKIPASIQALLTPKNAEPTSAKIPDSIAALLKGPGTSRALQGDKAQGGYGESDFGQALTAGAAGLKANLARAAQTYGLDTGDYAEKQNRIAAEASSRIAAPQSFEQVQSLSDIPGYAKVLAGKSAAEMGAAMAGGVAGFALGGPVGAALGVGAASFPSGVGQATQSQIEETGTYDPSVSTAAGGAYAALSALVGPEAALARMGLKATGAGIIKGAKAGAVKGALTEPIQEVGQTLATDVLPRTTNAAYDILGADAQSRVKEAAIGGLILGAPLGGVAGGIEGRQPAPLTPIIQPEGESTDLLAAPKRQVPTGRTYDTPIKGEDLSGQTSFLPGYNSPNTGVVIRPEAAPETPFVDERTGDLFSQENLLNETFNQTRRQGLQGDFFGDPTQLNQAAAGEQAPGTPAFNPRQGALMLQDVGPGQAERTAQAMAPFQRGPAMSPQELIDTQTGVNAPAAGISAAGMRNRLNEPVVNPATGEPMGTMGDIYEQIADDQKSPETVKAEQVAAQIASERGAVRQFLKESGFSPKTAAYKAAMKAGKMESVPAALKKEYEASGSNQERASYIEDLYLKLTGREIDAQADVPVENIVPEAPQDIAAQLAAIADESSGKDTMLVTKGDPVPAALPEGVRAVETRQGTVISKNPAKIAKAQLDAETITSDGMGELLGYVGSKGDTDGTVVQARDANDNIVWEQATNRVDLDEVAAVAEDMKPEGGRIVATTADKSLAERTERANAPAPATQSVDGTDTGLETSAPVEPVQPAGVPAVKGRAKKRGVVGQNAAVAGRAGDEAPAAVPVPSEPKPTLTEKPAPAPETPKAKPARKRKPKVLRDDEPQTEAQRITEALYQANQKAQEGLAAEFDELSVEKGYVNLNKEPLTWDMLSDLNREAFEDGVPPAKIAERHRTEERGERAMEALKKANKRSGSTAKDNNDDLGDIDLYDDPKFSRTNAEFSTAGARVSMTEASALAWARSLSKKAQTKPFRDLMSRLVSSPAYSLLADVQVKFVPESELAKYDDQVGYDHKGLYLFDKNLILINMRYNTEEVLAHEILHAATLGKIRADGNLQGDILKLAEEVRDNIVKNLGENGTLTDEQFSTLEEAFGSSEEFVTYWYTSRVFRAMVERSAPGRLERLITKAMAFFGAIKYVFGYTARLPDADPFMTSIDVRMAEILAKTVNDPKTRTELRRGDRGPAVVFSRVAADAANNPEGKLYKSVAGMVDKALGPNSAGVYTATMRDKFVRWGLGILTNDQIVTIFDKLYMKQVGEKVMVSVRELVERMNRQEQDKNNIIAASDKIYRQMSAVLSQFKEEGQRMVKLAYEATYEQIDPSVPLEDQKWLFRSTKDEDGETVMRVPPEKKAKYEEMAAAYAEMAKNKDVLNVYDGIFLHAKEMRQMIVLELISQAERNYGTELTNILGEGPLLDGARALLRKQREAKYDSKEYKQIRADMNKLTQEMTDAAASVLTRYADAVGDVLSQDSQLKGPYLPLMRRGDYIYVYRSDALVKAHNDLKDLNEKTLAASRVDTSEAGVRRAQAEGTKARAELKKAQQKLKARPNNGTLKAAVKLAEEAVSKAAADLREANNVRKESPYRELRRQQAALRKEIQAMEADGDQYQVVFSDSEVEVKRLEAEQGGFSIRREEMNELARVDQGFASRIGLEATKDLSTEDAAVVRALTNGLYLQLSPQNNYLKRQISRGNVAGFSEDLKQNFMEHTRTVANLISKVRHSKEIFEGLEAMKNDTSGPQADREAKRAVFNEMKRRSKMTMAAIGTPTQDFLTKLGAFFYLGITPAFPLLNATQGALVTYPMLAARFGGKAAGKAMIKALGDSWNVYQPKNLFGKGALNYEVDPTAEGVNLTPGEKEMLATMQSLGRLNFSQVVELTDSTGNPKWDTLNRVSWHLPHHTEVMNRLYSALAAYRLATEAGQNQEQATQTAIDIVTDSHGNYNPDNKPRYFRQIYKPLTLFKSYAQMMAFATLRNAYQSLKGATPEERSQARWTMAYLAGMHQIFAGAVGLPGMGLIGAVANLFKDDEDEPWEYKTEMRAGLKEVFGDTLGDALYGGVFRLTPFDIGSRIGSADILTLGIRLEGDPGKRGGDEVVNQVYNLLGPVGSIGKGIGEGYVKAFEQGEYLKGLGLASPKAIGDVIKAINQGTEGEENRRGVQLQEFGALEVASQLIGITPTSKATAGEIRSSRYKYKTSLKNRRGDLLSLYSAAALDGDKERMAELDNEIEVFNESNPNDKIAPFAKRRAVQRLREQQASVTDGFINEEGDEGLPTE